MPVSVPAEPGNIARLSGVTGDLAFTAQRTASEMPRCTIGRSTKCPHDALLPLTSPNPFEPFTATMMGYPDGVGNILFKHYRDKNKVQSLINLGGLSSLGENIGPEKPMFDDRGMQVESVTVA